MSPLRRPANLPKVPLPYALVTTLIVASATHMAFCPGWVAVSYVLVASVFGGFIFWLNPTRKLEVQRQEFDDLKEQCQLLKEQLTATRMKIGFR